MWMEDLMMVKNEETVKNGQFGFGEKNIAFAKYFIGDSYLNNLITPDDNVDVHVANVSYEPGCRYLFCEYIDQEHILVQEVLCN